MEMTKPTMWNLFVCIDRLLVEGYGYCLLVGEIRQGTRMLLDDPEEPLLVAEMISIGNSRHVRMWWSMNSPSELIDLLFCGHRTLGADGTPPPGTLKFGSCENRGQSPNQSIHSDESDSDGQQPKSSTAAARRITRLSIKRTGSSMRKSGQRVRRGPADSDELEPDSDRSSATRGVQPLDPGFIPSSTKQPSAPPTDLGIRALKSGRQIGRESDLKKVFPLSTWTAVNRSGKRDPAVMAEVDKMNGPAETAEPPRKVARSVPIIDCSIEGKLDRLHGEVNRTQQPTATPSLPNSPPPLAPNPSHDLASAASEQLQLRTLAEPLLMLTSCAQQPATTSVTQLGTPSRSHSPCNLCTDDALVAMAAADAGRKLGPAASSRPSSSGYFTPGKLRLQLPGLSYAMLAAGPTALSAETDLRSPLQCISAH